MAVANLAQGANDTFPTKSNGTERTVALGNTPASFSTATAVSIDVEYSLAGYDNDDYIDLDVWIETSGAVLLASETSSWKKVDSRTSNTGTTTSGTLTFNTVNTTADKADWDGAVLRYRQTLGANMGADSAAYTTTTNTQVDVTYTANDALTADDIQSGSQVSKPAIGQIHALTADSIQSGSETGTPALAQEHALLADNIQSGSQVSSPVLVVDTQNELLADDIQSGSQVSSPALSENIEYLRPDADQSAGSWTTDLGGSSNLYQQIDEVVANDSDYIRSELGPSTSAYRGRLSDLTESGDVTANNLVRYRYRKGDINGQRIDLTVRLIEGASTVIASWVHNDIAHTIVGAEQALSAPQKASISNYNNLFIEFEANAP